VLKKFNIKLSTVFVINRHINYKFYAKCTAYINKNNYLTCKLNNINKNIEKSFSIQKEKYKRNYLEKSKYKILEEILFKYISRDLLQNDIEKKAEKLMEIIIFKIFGNDIMLYDIYYESILKKELTFINYLYKLEIIVAQSAINVFKRQYKLVWDKVSKNRNIIFFESDEINPFYANVKIAHLELSCRISYLFFILEKKLNEENI
jgi:hypothetical protein